MGKSVISTGEAPEAIGPYSQAISSDTLVFCSGQIGLDPSSGELASDDVAGQTRRAMRNLDAVLAGAGASLSNVVKVTAYLVDMDDFAAFNDAYGDFFPDDPPARATVGVAALPKGARVEVECVART
ncbi:MAG: RidA family protein [Actinomycetota bacterium]